MLCPSKWLSDGRVGLRRPSLLVSDLTGDKSAEEETRQGTEACVHQREPRNRSENILIKDGKNSVKWKVLLTTKGVFWGMACTHRTSPLLSPSYSGTVFYTKYWWECEQPVRSGCVLVEQKFKIPVLGMLYAEENKKWSECEVLCQGSVVIISGESRWEVGCFWGSWTQWGAFWEYCGPNSTKHLWSDRIFPLKHTPFFSNQSFKEARFQEEAFCCVKYFKWKKHDRRGNVWQDIVCTSKLILTAITSLNKRVLHWI